MTEKCVIGFEVSRTAAGMTRSVVFVSRSHARAFQKSNPGSTIQAVELCSGRIRRRGKGTLRGPMRRRRRR